jgi:hypothetical protein
MGVSPLGKACTVWAATEDFMSLAAEVQAVDHILARPLLVVLLLKALLQAQRGLHTGGSCLG